jgi:hypothetical protein
MQKKICNPRSIYVDEKEEIRFETVKCFVVLPVKLFAGLPAKW